VGFACTAVASCASSLDCTARKQVCAPVTPPSYPATATQACQDCATSNDCPAGNACQSGVCVDVCGARVCGSVDGVDCGTCPGQGPVQAICLDSGRACMEMIAYATSGRGFGDDPIFALGQLLWTERVSLGSVYALDVATGDTVVIATGQDNPEGVASTATNYYWGAGNSVYQRARSGGAATITASFPGQEERCISLTIAPGQIYCGVYSFTENGDGVYRAPLGGGGTMTSVVSDGYPSVISRGQNVYFLGDARLGFHDAGAAQPQQHHRQLLRRRHVRLLLEERRAQAHRRRLACRDGGLPEWKGRDVAGGRHLGRDERLDRAGHQQRAEPQQSEPGDWAHHRTRR
jgi:hypothetical protein